LLQKPEAKNPITNTPATAKTDPTTVRDGTGISVSLGNNLVKIESGNGGNADITICDNRIGCLGFVEMALNAGDKMSRDSSEAKLEIKEGDSRVLIESYSETQHIDISKMWTVYPDHDLLKYEAVVMQDSLIRLRMGGIELDPAFNNSHVTFNRISDGAALRVQDQRYENLSLFHLGNGLLNYSSNACGLTVIVDKKISAPGFMRLDAGRYFLMAEQAGDTELPVQF